MTKNGYRKNGIIALCSIVYFVSYFSRKDFAAVMAAMLSDSVLDKSTAGLIGTMLFAFYGVGQLLSGYLGDKIKPKYLLIIGLFSTSLFNLLMPVVPSTALMIPVWAGNGLAQAMLWPPIVKILSNSLDQKTYVKANFVVTSAAHIATVLLYLYVPVCLEFMGWREVFFTSSALAFAVMIVFIIAMQIILPRDEEVKPRVSAAAPSTEKAVCENIPVFRSLVDSGMLTVFGCIVMCGFLRDGIESWLPTLYSEAFNRDASESILVSVILPVASIVSISVILALHKNKLFNNEVVGAAILFLVSAVICIPLAILITVKTTVARVICLILAALVCAAMHGVNFLLISCVPGRFARLGRASTVSGLTNACIYIGAASSMYGFAILSSSIGWFGTVIFWIGVASLGVLLAIPAVKKYTAFIKN